MSRAAPLVGASLFGPFLTKGEVYSSQKASAVIPRTIAGRNRAYYEHIVGNTLTDQTPIAPANPRGQLGEDHSGGGWGRPIKHTFFHMSFLDTQNAPTFYELPPQISRTGTPNDVIKFIDRLDVYIPHCWRGGAYEEFQLDFAVMCKSITGGPFDIGVALYPENVTSPNYATTSIAAANTYYTGNTTLSHYKGGPMWFELAARDTGTYVVELCSLSLSQIS